MSVKGRLVRQISMGELVESSLAGTREADDIRRNGALDRADFGQLYLRYRDPVFRYVRRLSGSEDDAADLTARTFERALAKLHTYRGDGAGFAPWLFRIARNQARDARRRTRPWLPIQLLGTAAHPHEPSTPEGTALRRESIWRGVALPGRADGAGA